MFCVLMLTTPLLLTVLSIWLITPSLVSAEPSCGSVDDCLLRSEKLLAKELAEQVGYLETALNFEPTNEQRATIYFKLGKLWTGLGFINKAIESVCWVFTVFVVGIPSRFFFLRSLGLAWC